MAFMITSFRLVLVLDQSNCHPMAISIPVRHLMQDSEVQPRKWSWLSILFLHPGQVDG
jgi:hypothetical protein